MTYLQIAIALVAFVAIAPLALPRTVNVERDASISGDHSAEILALAASNEGYQRFNPYHNTDPDLKIEPFGPPSGVGSGFRFEGKEGKGSQIVRAVSPDAVDFDIDLGAMGKPKQRIMARTVAGSTQVNWSMEADLGYNPIARVMGLFMDKFVGPTFERGLDNLEAAI